MRGNYWNKGKIGSIRTQINMVHVRPMKRLTKFLKIKPLSFHHLRQTPKFQRYKVPGL